MIIRTIKRAYNAARSGFDGLWNTFTPVAQIGAGALPESWQRVARPAERVVMVYACLTARRETIGSVPLRVTDGEGNPLAGGALGRLLDQPNGAMGWRQYIRTLETYLTLHNCMAVAKVGDNPDRPDELVPLHPLGLKPVVGVHAPTGTPIARAWEYRDPITQEQREYQPEELILEYGANPDAPLSFLSPLAPLTQTIQSDQAARAANLAAWANDGTPPFVLETDQQIDPGRADEIRDQFESRSRGIRNRRRVAVLYGGLKAKTLGITPAEMEYLAGLKFSRLDYLGVFRVRAAMLGDMIGETGLSQGSSTDEQKTEWWEDVGLSELDLIAGAHQRALQGLAVANRHYMRAWQPPRPAVSWRRSFIRRAAPQGEGPGVYLWFDDGSIPALAHARTAKIEQLDKLISRGWAPDAASEYLDLGMPPHPAGDIGLVNFNLIPVTQAAGIAAQEEQDAETPSAQADAGMTSLVVGDKIQETALNGAQVASLMQIVSAAVAKMMPIDTAAALIKASFPALTADLVSQILSPVKSFIPAENDSAIRALDDLENLLVRARPAPPSSSAPRRPPRVSAIRRSLDRIIDQESDAHAKRWSRYFVEQRGRILARLARIQDPAREETIRSDDPDIRRAAIDDIISAIWPVADENSALVARLQPLVEQTITRGWEQTVEELGDDLAAHPFAIDDPRIRAAIDSRRIQGLRVNATTESDLRRILSDGMEEGDTLTQLGDRIAEYYKGHIGADKARPQTAARTQVAGIVDEGRRAAAHEVGGGILKKSWLHGGSADPRPSHLRAEAEYSANPIGLDEQFVVDGEPCDGPGDASLSIANTANCTCSTIFVTP